MSGLAPEETAGPPRGTTMEERACDLGPSNQCVQDAIEAAADNADPSEHPPIHPVLTPEPVPGEISVSLDDSGLTDAEDVTAIAGDRVATALQVIANGSYFTSDITA